MARFVRTAAGSTLLGLALTLAATSSASAAEDPVTSPPPKRVAVGDSAPSFTLPATDGSSFDLAALRGKERAVVVFFRGSW